MSIMGTFSPAKITRPSLPDGLPRGRLFRLLDDMRQKPVIWVSAPAGSGKTTLASSYLQTSQIPFIWYQTDEGDSDIASFFYYMGLAFKNAVSHQKKPLPLLTPEYALGIPTFTKRFFEELFGRLPKPAALVLDNYQEVSEDSPLQQVVRDAMSVIPRGINLFVLSRNDPFKLFARLKANQSIAAIGWTDLRFTQQETHSLVKLHVREAVEQDLIDLLHQRMDGWVAGLILMLSQPEIRDLKPEALSIYKPEKIFDYFAAELYESTDKKIRNFLLKTSIFPRMTATMAAELSGEDRAEEILTRLNRDQFFTHKHTGSADIYQYHSLFREFLLTKTRSAFDSSSLARMRQKAASLLENEGYSEDAVALYTESGDLNGMIGLVLRLAPELMMQGRHKTLEHWISSIPTDVIENSPWLLYWLASSFMPINPQGSTPLFEKSLLIFAERAEAEGMLMSLSGILLSIGYALDDFSQFDVWIPQVETFRETHLLADAHPQYKALLTIGMVFALAVRHPEHSHFVQWWEDGFRLLEEDINLDIKFQLFPALIFNSVESGDLQRAESIIALSRQLARYQEVRPLDLLTLGDIEAYFLWLKSEFDACRTACSTSLQLAETTGVHVLDVFLLGHWAAVSLSSGDLERANVCLIRMKPQLKGSWSNVFYYLLMVWKYLLKRDFILAQSPAKLMFDYTCKLGMVQFEAIAYLGNSLVLHGQGEKEKADEYLNHAISCCRRGGLIQKQIEFACRLAKAEFAFYRENPEAVALLKEAFSLGHENQYLNFYFWRPDAMAKLCAVALEAGIEVEYVKEIITKRNLIPDVSAGSLDLWPWKLKIHTLGEFAVKRDEKPLKFQRKAPNKILSLLKALIALGGKEIQKEKIIDALWPDADGDIGNQSFATTLHRLRRLLDYPEAVELVEGKLSLNSNYCWIDALAFERFLDEADGAWNGESSDQTESKSIPLMKKGLDLYKGAFLSHESEEPLILAARERLRSKFLRAAVRLCKYLQDSGQPEEAVECYQRCLEVDDLAEELYAGLMKCYRRVGRAAEALSVYDRCRNVFSAKLGIEPSPKMEAVRESILQQQ